MKRGNLKQDCFVVPRRNDIRYINKKRDAIASLFVILNEMKME